MSKILIIGAGVMGSAFTFPCIDNGHKVTVLGSPLENDRIDELSKTFFHKILNCNVSKEINFLKSDQLSQQLKGKPDLIVVGVNSKGINWISKELNNEKNKIPILLLTKGLNVENNKFIILTDKFSNDDTSVVAGPCLAKDLAKKNKTGVVFANKNIELAKKISKLIKTNYYFIDHSDDLRGIEICAAIKNFYSMIIGSANELNTAALLLQRSLFEMRNFVKLLGGSESSVYGLAGLGDLYVSSAGGRNSKMGQYLGQGQIYTEAKTKFMPDETIEGAELAFQIGSKVLKDFPQKDFPLLHSLLDALCNNKKFNLKL